MSPESQLRNVTNWTGRRVLVTGHTGFKGGWLSLWLQALGAEVHGLALAAEPDSFYAQVAFASSLASDLTIDLRNLEVLSQSLQRSRPEVIFHLAAQSLVRRSYREPQATVASNVLGTVNLLEAARACGSVKAIVLVTTDKVYENREWIWPYRESDRLGGHDPYAASKACCELLAASWRESFLRAEGIALATARAGNVIGGGDWAEDRIVPDYLRAAEQGVALEVRSPQAIRPWQHVLEPLSGYLHLAAGLLRGAAWQQAWNFGPREEDARPVAALLEELQRCLPGVEVRSPTAAQPHESQRLQLDISAAQHRLGWRPRWRLEEAVRRTVDWQQARLRGEDLHAFSLQQIADYQQAAH